MKGRPPKTTDRLKLHGGYRADRHGERNEPVATGEPIKPEFGDEWKEASAHWDDVVPGLIANGTAKAQDAPSLRVMCELWQFLRRSMSAAVAEPTDKELRCAVTSYKQAWETLAAKCGLTPSDRARLNIGKEKEKPSGKRNLIVG